MKAQCLPSLLLCIGLVALALPGRAATTVTECETVHVFGTGLSAAGAALPPGSVDSFFQGVGAPFPNPPSTVVPTNVPGAWLANPASAQSQWIAPLLDPAQAAAGVYLYRLTFTNPCAGGRVQGRFAASDRAGLWLNGAPAGVATPSVGWTNWTSFALNNLLAGTNTLDFRVTNAPSAGGPPGPSGLRAELTVVATCCPCIVLDCPPNLAVTHCTPNEPVSYQVTGTNRCGPDLQIECTPPSGSVFPTGSTTVNCLASDRAGHRTNCAFTVTVIGDSQPPQLVVPARLIVPCTSPAGATVEFPVAARDGCGTNVTVECRPPSGSVLPPGTHLVSCTATDAWGNRASVEFPVIVNGGCATGRCPDLTVPDELTVRCAGSGGAVVTFSATGRDTCTGAQLAPVCQPPSGSVFPVGLTRVVCTVRVGADEATAGFLVEVTDDAPPQMTCPGDLRVPAQRMAGAVVAFAASGTDDCSPPVGIRCSPPSGSEFPVGTTRVLCEGTDRSGNRATCAFTVTVDPPPPFRASVQPSNRVELRWTGDAIVEATDALGDEAQWRELGGAVLGDGSVRTLSLTPTGAQQFFRLRPLPLVSPPDADGDGVPDAADRCPSTPPGSVVDAQGCSALDFLAAPDGVFEPERGQGQRTLRRLQQDGGFSNLVSRLAPQLDSSNHPALFLNERRLPEALASQSNLVTELRNALAEFQRLKPLRIAEILRGAARLSRADADVRPQDFELMQLDDIEQSLLDVLGGSERSLLTLSNLAHAAGQNPTRERVRIRSFDPVRGVAMLADGREVLLPAVQDVGAPPIDQIRGVLGQDNDVDLEISRLPDGSLFGHGAMPGWTVNPSLVWKLDPRCLRLRVLPANPGLPDFEFGERHHLRAYKWGFSENASYHFLEFGMGLAAVKINCPTETPGAYRHWLQIKHDSNLDGVFTLLISRLDETSLPYVLKPTALPQNKPFPLLVREFRAAVQSDGTEGQPELLGEETVTVEINGWGYYAEAFYSKTIFELEDKPANQSTEFQTATVNDLALRFPLTLKPLNQHTFTAWSYTPAGNSSSHPNVNQITLNQPFAVHVDDPNYQSFFAYSNDVGRALYAPTLSGYNHGKPYRYRVTLPQVVRDRVHECAGTDSYYRIPFWGPLAAGYYGPWRVSQGNNGSFTHNGWQKYAWDFPKEQGTGVLAARGGIVVDKRESGSQSCWDDDLEDCVNCSGSKAGNFVKILHQDGTAGVYVHFKYNGVAVSVGQRVYRGDLLGYVGTTGCSTGPHLHFHVITDPDTNETIPARFEAYDDDFDFRACYLPPSDSKGFSTNKPWWWAY